MRVVFASVAVGWTAMMLLAAVIASVAVPLVPYLVAGFLIGAALRAHRRHHDARNAVTHRPVPPPALIDHRSQGGWVYVPVWVAPTQRAAPVVIDADVLQERPRA